MNLIDYCRRHLGVAALAGGGVTMARGHLRRAWPTPQVDLWLDLPSLDAADSSDFADTEPDVGWAGPGEPAED
ncbi:MAG: hypothetical protein M3Z29_11535 [Pseudomonadota bacterium]|nr:hypothetical protein [Pseudomonadota bacterium]